MGIYEVGVEKVLPIPDSFRKSFGKLVEASQWHNLVLHFEQIKEAVVLDDFIGKQKEEA